MPREGIGRWIFGLTANAMLITGTVLLIRAWDPDKWPWFLWPIVVLLSAGVATGVTLAVFSVFVLLLQFARWIYRGEVWNTINKAVRIGIVLAIGFSLGAVLTHGGGWAGGQVFRLGTTTISRSLVCLAVITGLVFLSLWTEQQARHETWDQEQAEAEQRRAASAETVLGMLADAYPHRDPAPKTLRGEEGAAVAWSPPARRLRSSSRL